MKLPSRLERIRFSIVWIFWRVRLRPLQQRRPCPLLVRPQAVLRPRQLQLVAVALPHRAGGKVWRVATSYDGTKLHQVSEADVGPTVVLVFKALKAGNARIEFGLTKGETAKAFESRQFVVMIVPS